MSLACILSLLRANHSQHVTKALRKAIIRRSKLENGYFKKQTNESLKAYKKQKNYCSKLYKKEREKILDNLNTSVVSNNKTLCKVSFVRNIKLIQKKEILKDDTEFAEE